MKEQMKLWPGTPFDNRQKPCTNCNEGVYEYLTIWDDWEGFVTCTECGHRVKSFGTENEV